jgi:3D (Asp-Asp-Asp) domain-containing protein
MSQLGLGRIFSSSPFTGLNGWAGFTGRALGRPDDRVRLSEPPRDQGRSCVRGDGRAVGAGRSEALIEDAGVAPGAFPQVIARRLLKALAGLGLVALTATSAVLVKEMRAGNVRALPMASVSEVNFADVVGMEMPEPVRVAPARAEAKVEPAPKVIAEEAKPAAETRAKPTRTIWPSGTRFFNGRPIRPVKTMKMTVTGYSPDARSCGGSADGITATLHSVHTNAHRLVAADPRVLAYGSMLTIPGYDSGHVVPVLDCGGAIKGNRLDLLFPTHEQALKWGKRKVTVTVWGYADGKPAPNPRKARDGKK